MGYVTPEQIAEARKLDLFSYLQNYEPQELIHFGGNTYCTREHDSLKISNGKWFWFSRGIGGVSALDYLIKVKEIPFLEAVEMIIGRTGKQPPTHISHQKDEKRKTILLPQKNVTDEKVKKYLCSRGIDPEIISYCISTRQLYESFPHHSAVFLGKDREGEVRYAFIRGTETHFVGEANGSDKRYSFSFPAEHSDTLCLFESAIDLLSFATLLKLYGKPWNADHLVSLAGVYKPKQEMQDSSLPLALNQYLSDQPNIRTVHLCLDNDIGGRLATDALKLVLSERYGIEVKERFPPGGKDYNDYLCDLLGLQRTTRKAKATISLRPNMEVEKGGNDDRKIEHYTR